MRFRGGGIGHATAVQTTRAQQPQDALDPEQTDAHRDPAVREEGEDSGERAAMEGEQDSEGEGDCLNPDGPDGEDGDSIEDDDTLLFPDSEPDPSSDNEDGEDLAMEDDGDDLDYFD